MSAMNDRVQKNAYLSLFELHLMRVKPYTTKEAVLTKMRNKQCIFSGLLSHFKGDSAFREMRQYFAQRCKDRGLLHSMLFIIDKTL